MVGELLWRDWRFPRFSWTWWWKVKSVKKDKIYLTFPGSFWVPEKCLFCFLALFKLTESSIKCPWFLKLVRVLVAFFKTLNLVSGSSWVPEKSLLVSSLYLNLFKVAYVLCYLIKVSKASDLILKISKLSSGSFEVPENFIFTFLALLRLVKSGKQSLILKNNHKSFIFNSKKF